MGWPDRVTAWFRERSDFVLDHAARFVVCTWEDRGPPPALNLQGAEVVEAQRLHDRRFLLPVLTASECRAYGAPPPVVLVHLRTFSEPGLWRGDRIELPVLDYAPRPSVTGGEVPPPLMRASYRGVTLREILLRNLFKPEEYPQYPLNKLHHTAEAIASFLGARVHTYTPPPRLSWSDPAKMRRYLLLRSCEAKRRPLSVLRAMCRARAREEATRRKQVFIEASTRLGLDIGDRYKVFDEGHTSEPVDVLHVSAFLPADVRARLWPALLLCALRLVLGLDGDADRIQPFTPLPLAGGPRWLGYRPPQWTLLSEETRAPARDILERLKALRGK